MWDSRHSRLERAIPQNYQCEEMGVFKAFVLFFRAMFVPKSQVGYRDINTAPAIGCLQTSCETSQVVSTRSGVLGSGIEVLGGTGDRRIYERIVVNRKPSSDGTARDSSCIGAGNLQGEILDDRSFSATFVTRSNTCSAKSQREVHLEYCPNFFRGATMLLSRLWGSTWFAAESRRHRLGMLFSTITFRVSQPATLLPYRPLHFACCTFLSCTGMIGDYLFIST